MGGTNSTGSYLKYAFGEIILVVIGILIALYIKGEYQEKEDSIELDRIGMQIVSDLKSDTADVNLLVREYQPLESKFLMLMSDTTNPDSLMDCNLCPYLISSFSPFIISQNGYSILKERQTDYLTAQDSLIHDTKAFYEKSIPTMELLVELIEDDVRSNLRDWREHQPWYYKWVLGIPSKEFDQYMINDPIFKNKVANFYLLTYKNYLIGLQQYANRAEKLADRWEKQLK